MDRDDEGRDDDADAGRLDTSRLALPLGDASSVGEAITVGNEERALLKTGRGNRSQTEEDKCSVFGVFSGTHPK